MPLIRFPAAGGVAKNPNDYAIVVGIDTYLDGIPQLSGCINDSQLFCRWLMEPTMGGLDPEKVMLFVSKNPTDQQPMRDQIENLLADFIDLANQGKLNGRRLYLFFAGHGLILPPPDKRGCALVMANARLNFLRGLHGLSAAESMRLTGLFQEVMLVMDCCAEVSGPADLNYNLPWHSDTTLPNRAFLHIQAAQLNAMAAEDDLPDPFGSGVISRQGLLTNMLIRGLMSAADANGEITANSLKTFLEAASVGTPVIEIGAGAPPAPEMTFGSPLGLLVKVQSNGSAATHFQVRDGAAFDIVVTPRNLPGHVHLAPGQYLFDGLSAEGVIVSSKPVPVREGGTDVHV